MFYKSVVVECSTGTEDLAKAIEKKAEEMMKKGTYKIGSHVDSRNRSSHSDI